MKNQMDIFSGMDSLFDLDNIVKEASFIKKDSNGFYKLQIKETTGKQPFQVFSESGVNKQSHGKTTNSFNDIALAENEFYKMIEEIVGNGYELISA